MSQQTENGHKSFKVGATAVSLYQRVKLDASGDVVPAGSDEWAVGVVQAFQTDGGVGDHVGVRLVNAQGTHKMIANEAFVVGANLYGGADGKVQDTDPGSGTVRYLALEAATADNDVVEVLVINLA